MENNLCNKIKTIFIEKRTNQNKTGYLCKIYNSAKGKDSPLPISDIGPILCACTCTLY